MKKQNLRYCIFFLLSILVLGCENDYQNHECDPIDCGSIGGPTYYHDSVDYIEPVFNPNNSDEFMAIRILRAHDTVPEKNTLEKFNYANGTHQVILSNQYLVNNNIWIGKFNWSSNGWVVFENLNDGQIYKMQDDGTSVTQLTFDGSSFMPNFTYNEDKIFFDNFSNTYQQYFGVLMDINTNAFLDTIYETGYIGGYDFATSLSNNKIVCAKQDNRIRVIDENGLALLDIFSPVMNISNFTNYIYFRNIAGNTNEVIFIAGYIGICKVDLVSHAATLIKPSCANRLISRLSVSSDGNKIIYELDTYDAPNDPCNVSEQLEIHIMNIDGTNDQKLNLP